MFESLPLLLERDSVTALVGFRLLGRDPSSLSHSPIAHSTMLRFFKLSQGKQLPCSGLLNDHCVLIQQTSRFETLEPV
jgi:hypothetical protein